ncbi:MAG TPA: hypothetical protein ENN21_05600 [Spirochaetes bacterium]|nr:hypothetical protein [Spirochaetota bacterium]
MNENLNAAIDSLSEQTTRMKIAMYYVNGDMEKAREMLSGSYRDLYVLKGTFYSASLNGAFIVFYNCMYNKHHDSHMVIIPTFMTKHLDTAVDWKLFEKELLEVQAQPEYSSALSASLKSKLNENFNAGFLKELTRFIENNNTITIERNFQKLIQYAMSLQRMDLKIDFQPLSSLDMELYSVTAHKTDPAGLAMQSQEGEKKEEPKSDTGGEVVEGRDGVKLVLAASVILAPIKGKDISALEPGDRIKVNIIDKNPKAITIAQALDAYVDGKLKPVTARIKTISHEPGKGFTIHAIIAKGIVVKVAEEETNIKVQMDSTYELSRSAAESEKSSVMPIVIAFAALLAVVGIVLALFLL